jgi:hypothetical protein
MSRWLEREEKKQEGGAGFETLSRSGSDKRERSIPEKSEQTDFGENTRERVHVRGKEFWVRPSEREALYQIGRFRVVYEADLVKGVYSGRKELADSDLRSLRNQRLISTLSFHAGRSGNERIHSLSPIAQDLVEKIDPRVERDAQQIYYGTVKASELEHDAHVYRAFQHEEKRLHAEGYRVKRVVLDFELKQKLFSKQEKLRGKKPYREIQRQTAAELNLQVVDGRVMLPDLRVEYEDERGAVGRVDLEVATGNYRGAHLAAKMSAGFRVYGAPSFYVEDRSSGEECSGRSALR